MIILNLVEVKNSFWRQTIESKGEKYRVLLEF